MNQRFISVLIFAFVVAAGASLLLYRVMAGRQSTHAAPATTKVILAARKLEIGTVIRESDLKSGDWTGTPPPGSSVKADTLVGRGVISTIYENEPLVDNRLAAKGAGGGLAAMIPKGMRAVAVRVNEVVGVAGFVLPGMRVDVLISGNPPGGANVGSLTRTLLQNIEVLSAGQDFKKDNEGKPVSVQVVNLLVTPEQAEKLSLASHQATIQLVLRNPLDTQTAETTGVALSQIFGQPRPNEDAPRPFTPRARPSVRPQPPPAKEPFVMEVINGSKRTEARFAGASEAH